MYNAAQPLRPSPTPTCRVHHRPSPLHSHASPWGPRSHCAGHDFGPTLEIPAPPRGACVYSVLCPAAALGPTPCRGRLPIWPEAGSGALGPAWPREHVAPAHVLPVPKAHSKVPQVLKFPERPCSTSASGGLSTGRQQVWITVTFLSAGWECRRSIWQSLFSHSE